MQNIDDEIEHMVVTFAHALGADAAALGDDVDQIISRECIARIGRHGPGDQIGPAEAEALLHLAWLEAARLHQTDVCPAFVFNLVEAMLDCVAEASPSIN